jgi:hypothetical protein
MGRAARELKDKLNDAENQYDLALQNYGSPDFGDDLSYDPFGFDEFALGYPDQWTRDHGYDNFSNDSVNNYWDNSPYDSFDDFSGDPYNFDEYGLGYPDTWDDEGNLPELGLEPSDSDISCDGLVAAAMAAAAAESAANNNKDTVVSPTDSGDGPFVPAGFFVPLPEGVDPNSWLGKQLMNPYSYVPGPGGVIGAGEGMAAQAFLQRLEQLGSVDADTALGLGLRWLGNAYEEIGPGVFRSADELRQFRMTTSDLVGSHGGGPHLNFELLNEAGQVLKNVHLPLKP